MTPRQSFVRRLQVGLGALVVISLLGLVAILMAERRAGAALESSQGALSLLEDFKQVQLALAAVGAAEREFLLEDLRTPNFFSTGTSPALEQHARMLSELDALLTSLERDPRAAEPDVIAMRQAISSYSESFEELVSLHRERGSLYSGLLGQMRAASFTLLELTSQSDERWRVALRGELLELMRDQSDYVRDLDNRPRFLVTERIQILREESALLDSAHSEKLHAQIEAYDRAWQRMLEIDERIGRSSGAGVRGQLRSSQATVLPLTSAAVERARARFEAALRSVEQTAAMGRRVIDAAGILSAVVALGLGISLRRHLRASLSTLLRAVESYAAGNRRARVGRLAREDEFALLGRAFDRMAETLAETTEELEEINASLKLAVKGDTAGLMERIKRLVAERSAKGH